jgi:hypothetical protein
LTQSLGQPCEFYLLDRELGSVEGVPEQVAVVEPRLRSPTTPII